MNTYDPTYHQKYKDALNKLKSARLVLTSKLKSLVDEYVEYQSYFKKEDGDKAKEKAESRFYSYMYDLLQVDAYGEGRFSLEHRSLKTRMDENKEERNKIAKEIKGLKDQMADLHQKLQVK